jgi:hypothetical protein
MGEELELEKEMEEALLELENQKTLLEDELKTQQARTESVSVVRAREIKGRSRSSEESVGGLRGRSKEGQVLNVRTRET